MKTITVDITTENHLANQIVASIYEAVRSTGAGVTVDFGERIETSMATAMTPIVCTINAPQEYKGHPHAALMAEYAKDAAETSTPWLLWELEQATDEGGKWIPCNGTPAWYEFTNYRRKPKTIRIGEFDVPEPLRVAPAIGIQYFVSSITHPNAYTNYQWAGDDQDIEWLESGLCHSTPENAALHAKALISLTSTKAAA